jgi:hypothetical protein
MIIIINDNKTKMIILKINGQKRKGKVDLKNEVF